MELIITPKPSLKKRQVAKHQELDDDAGWKLDMDAVDDLIDVLPDELQAGRMSQDILEQWASDTEGKNMKFIEFLRLNQKDSLWATWPTKSCGTAIFHADRPLG